MPGVAMHGRVGASNLGSVPLTDSHVAKREIASGGGRIQGPDRPIVP